jgi:hypothetical protein
MSPMLSMAWDWDKSHPEIPIQKSKPAPYSGVLIPEDNYRVYRNILEIDKAIEEQDLQKNILQCEAEKYDSFSHAVLWATLGLVTGVVIFHH